jgi:hypothetical protein
LARVPPPQARAKKAFDRACALYEDIAATLTQIVIALQSQGSSAEPLGRAEMDLIRIHQKSVLTVLDLEAQLLKKRTGDAAGAPRRGIDLDAARSEITGRLARLSPAGGT